jgi:beta-glucuronidase
MVDESRSDGESRRGLVTRRGAVGAAGGMVLAGVAARLRVERVALSCG